MMFQNGSQLSRVRILSPKSVELMTVDHAGQLYSGGTIGFGFGFSIVKDPGASGLPGTVGSYGWSWAYFTSY